MISYLFYEFSPTQRNDTYSSERVLDDSDVFGHFEQTNSQGHMGEIEFSVQDY